MIEAPKLSDAQKARLQRKVAQVFPKKNPAAVALGKMGAGKPKSHIPEAEQARRRQWAQAMAEKRRAARDAAAANNNTQTQETV